MNDFNRVGVVRGAKEMGYRVPKDVSILGFGDIHSAAITDPLLAKVRKPFQMLG